jgi:hypothetical protein
MRNRKYSAVLRPCPEVVISWSDDMSATRGEGVDSGMCKHSATLAATEARRKGFKAGHLRTSFERMERSEAEES